MLKKQNNKIIYKIFLALSFFVLSLLFSLPLMRHGVIYSGDDLSYHIARLNELFLNYKNGNYFVGISSFEFSKIGYPVNLFYPWVTLLPFVILRILTGKAILSIYLGISFYSFLTLVFTYICTLRLSKNNKLQSFITAVIYTFCAYRVIDIFARFALGEFLSLTFLPLVFYGFFAIMFGKYNDWPYLGLGLSFIMLSHILSTYISICVLILLFVTFFYWIHDKKKRLFALLKSVILFILSSAIFLFPFLEQENFQKFLQPSIDPLHSTELIFSNLISQSLNNNLNGALNSSGSTYNIGTILIIALFVGFFQYRKWEPIYRGTYILGIILTIFTTNLIPWLTLEHSFLSIIQFPWRFLGISSLMLSVIAGKEVSILYGERERFRNQICIILIVCLFVFVPWFSGIQNFKLQPEATAIVYRYDNQKLTGPLFLDQYSPKAGQKVLGDNINHIGIIDQNMHAYFNVSAKANSLILKNNNMLKAKIVVLPIFNYKNIKVYNSKNEIKHTTDQYSRILVHNPNSKELKVKYIPSALDFLSIMISIITWITCCLIYILRKIKKIMIYQRNKSNIFNG